MTWQHWIACFFGGAFLTNAIPHVVSGWTGRRFPTVFSKPPGVGLSSPIVNHLWGSANLVAAYALLCLATEFQIDSIGDVSTAFTGSMVAGLYLASHFGKLPQD